MIVDVHAHLDFEDFSEDIKEVISRAKDSGVSFIINNGINLSSNLKTLELSKKYKIVKAALGYYPVDALKDGIKAVKKEADFIRKNSGKIVAIGEVGLDFKENKEVEKQKEIFQIMISLAKELSIPIIVHSRNAEEEVIAMLEENKMKKVVMHCFCGKMNLVERCCKNKWMFSIPGNIVRSEQFKMLVEKIPSDLILTESDAPFLSPILEKRNEPAFISKTISKIAEIKKLNVEETEKIIFFNYQRTFS